MNGRKTKQLRKHYNSLSPDEKSKITFRKFKKVYQQNKIQWNKSGVLV
jgi:hypothetical protein